ncbi:hypothetical protein ABK040_011078 [Willaertia magna]
MDNLTDEQKEQIQILQSFLEQGLMDIDDFEEEKRKILSGGNFEDQEEEEEEEIPIKSGKQQQQATTTTSSTSGAKKNNNYNSASDYSSGNEGVAVVSGGDDDSDDEPVIKSTSRKPNNTSSVKSTSTPVSTPTTTTKQTQPTTTTTKAKFKLNLSSEEKSLLTKEQIEQLEKMASLVDSEILSEDEVLNKKQSLVQTQRKKIEEEKKKNSTSSPVNKVDDQLNKLKAAYDMGVLTEDEYNKKRKQILGTQSDSSSESEDKDSKVKLTQQQRDQISKLDALLEQGILEQHEYEEKKKQVMGLSSPSASTATPSKIVPTPKDTKEESGDTTEMIIYMTNIKASNEQPFRLIYEGEHVMYERKDDAPQGKTIIVRGKIPKQPKEDVIASLTIDMPKVNIHMEQNFNLTEHGRFIKVDVSQEGNKNNIRIKQQHDDSFDQNQQAGDKNDEMSKVYIHYAAIPASEQKPFKLWINEMLAHQLTQSMAKTQSGVIRGSIPKTKRCNEPNDPNHCIKLKVYLPMVDDEEKTYVVNLTENGEHIDLSIEDDVLTVKQSKTENFDEKSLVLECQSKPVAKKPKKLSEENIQYLKQLAELRDQGIITSEEFEEKKKAIMYE